MRTPAQTIGPEWPGRDFGRRSASPRSSRSSASPSSTVSPSSRRCFRRAKRRSVSRSTTRSSMRGRPSSKGRRARPASGKMLMVTFGANWCPGLHYVTSESLRSGDARLRPGALRDRRDRRRRFEEAAVQRDLGMSVTAIPLAMFYSSTGEPWRHVRGRAEAVAPFLVARDS